MLNSIEALKWYLLFRISDTIIEVLKQVILNYMNWIINSQIISRVNTVKTLMTTEFSENLVLVV